MRSPDPKLIHVLIHLETTVMTQHVVSSQPGQPASGSSQHIHFLFVALPLPHPGVNAVNVKVLMRQYEALQLLVRGQTGHHRFILFRRLFAALEHCSVLLFW